MFSAPKPPETQALSRYIFTGYTPDVYRPSVRLDILSEAVGFGGVSLPYIYRPSSIRSFKIVKRAGVWMVIGGGAVHLADAITQSEKSHLQQVPHPHVVEPPVMGEPPSTSDYPADGKRN